MSWRVIFIAWFPTVICSFICVRRSGVLPYSPNSFCCRGSDGVVGWAIFAVEPHGSNTFCIKDPLWFPVCFLGVSRRVLGVSGCLWVSLGASWVPLGCLLAASWCLLILWFCSSMILWQHTVTVVQYHPL